MKYPWRVARLRRHDAYRVMVGAFQPILLHIFANTMRHGGTELRLHRLLMRDRGYALPRGLANSFNERRADLAAQRGLFRLSATAGLR